MLRKLVPLSYNINVWMFGNLKELDTYQCPENQFENQCLDIKMSRRQNAVILCSALFF